MRIGAASAGSLAAMFFFGAASASATQLPAGFQETTVATGLSGATSMAWGPAGEIYVTGRAGSIWVVRAGAPEPIEIGTITVAIDGERGLSGIAVDPDFTANQQLWIYYTSPEDPVRNRLARVSVRRDRLAGEEVLFEGPELTHDRHNGGCLRWAPDNTLFLTVGDDYQGAVTAQDPHDIRGKVLRLDREGGPAPGNPFRGNGDGDPRVWAMGFRNPWRCAVRPGTAQLFVGDVGEDKWEEIDVVTAGANYGWPTVEGPEPAGRAGFTYPLFSYGHTGDGRAAVIGGEHAGGGAWKPEYRGQYFFADFSQGRIYRMVLDGQSRPVWTEVWATDVPNPAELRFGPDGALYYLANGIGELRRIAFVGDAATNTSRKR
jgi:glucose/arabinose dehydrogenase